MVGFEVPIVFDAADALDQLGAGLRVPDDLAITGFDDIPAAAVTKPTLTTVRLPMRELGARTALVLRRTIEGDHEAEANLDLDTRLVLRASGGCPYVCGRRL